MLKCLSLPALVYHQIWNSRLTDTYLHSNKFCLILFSAPILGTRPQQPKSMYQNSCVGCGCTDCQCFISLLVPVVHVLATVLWRQWDLAVNLKVGVSFLGEIRWVTVGSVLSLTRSSVSSEIRIVPAGHYVVLWVQLPWVSILFIPIVFQCQHWLLACSITSSFELQSGPSACWPSRRLTSGGKRASFHETPVLETCYIFVYTKQLPEFKGKRQYYLNFIFNLHVKSVVLVSADANVKPCILAVLAACIFRAPSSFHMLSVFWNC